METQYDGYLRSPPHDFMGRVADVIPKTLNLGISGNRPLMELAGLAEYGPALKPRVVLWFFFGGNDIQGNLNIEKRSPLLRNYVHGNYE